MNLKPQDYIIAYLKASKERGINTSAVSLSKWLAIKLKIKERVATSHVNSALYSGLILSDREHVYLSKVGERLASIMQISHTEER